MASEVVTPLGQEPQGQDPEKKPSLQERLQRLRKLKEMDPEQRAALFRQRMEEWESKSVDEKKADIIQRAQKLREARPTPPQPEEKPEPPGEPILTGEDFDFLDISESERGIFRNQKTQQDPAENFPNPADIAQSFAELATEDFPMWTRNLVNKFGQGIQQVSFGVESLFSSNWPDWSRAPDDVAAIKQNIEKIKRGFGIPEPEFDIVRTHAASARHLAPKPGDPAYDPRLGQASELTPPDWSTYRSYSEEDIRNHPILSIIGKDALDEADRSRPAYLADLHISDQELKALKEQGIAADQAYLSLAREKKLAHAENKLSVEARDWLKHVEGVHEKVMSTGVGEVGMIASSVLAEIGLLTLPPGGPIMRGVAWGVRPVFSLAHRALTPAMRALARGGQLFPIGWLGTGLLSGGAREALSNGAREAWKGLFRGVLPRTTGYGAFEWVRTAYDPETGKMLDGYERIIHAAQMAAYWPVYEAFGASASLLARVIQKRGLPYITEGGEKITRDLALAHMRRMNLPRQKGESLGKYMQRAIDTWAQDGFRGLTRSKEAKNRLRQAMHNVIAHSIGAVPESFGFAMLDQQFRAQLAHAMVGSWDEEVGPEPPRMESFWGSLRTLMGNWIAFNGVKVSPWAVRSLEEAKNVRLTGVRLRQYREQQQGERDKAIAEGRTPGELNADAQQVLSDLDRVGLRSKDEHSFRVEGFPEVVKMENQNGQLVVQLPPAFVTRLGLDKGVFVGDEAIGVLRLYELELLANRAEGLRELAGEQIDTDGAHVIPGEPGQAPLVLRWNGKEVVASRLGFPDPGKAINLKIEELPPVAQEQATLASLVQRIATQVPELVEGSGLPDAGVKSLQRGLAQLAVNLGHIPAERSAPIKDLVDLLALQDAHVVTPEGAQPGIFGQLWNAAPTPQARVELLTNLMRLGSGSQHMQLSLERMAETIQPEVTEAKEGKKDETTERLDDGEPKPGQEGGDATAQEAGKADVDARDRGVEGRAREEADEADGSQREAARRTPRPTPESRALSQEDKVKRRKQAAKELKKLNRKEIKADPRIGELIDLAVTPPKERTKAQNLKARALGADKDLAKLGIDFGDYARERERGSVWDAETESFVTREQVQAEQDAAKKANEKEIKDYARDWAEGILANEGVEPTTTTIRADDPRTTGKLGPASEQSGFDRRKLLKGLMSGAAVGVTKPRGLAGLIVKAIKGGKSERQKIDDLIGAEIARGLREAVKSGRMPLSYAQGIARAVDALIAGKMPDRNEFFWRDEEGNYRGEPGSEHEGTHWEDALLSIQEVAKRLGLKDALVEHGGWINPLTPKKLGEWAKWDWEMMDAEEIAADLLWSAKENALESVFEGQPHRKPVSESLAKVEPPAPKPKPKPKKASPQLRKLREREAELREILEDKDAVVLDETGMPIPLGKALEPLPEKGVTLRIIKGKGKKRTVKDYKLAELTQEYAKVKRDLAAHEKSATAKQPEGPPVPEEMKADVIPDYVPVHSKEEAVQIVRTWSDAKKLTWHDAAESLTPEQVVEWAKDLAKPWSELATRKYHPSKGEADKLLAGLEKAVGGPLHKVEPGERVKKRILTWMYKTFEGRHPGGALGEVREIHLGDGVEVDLGARDLSETMLVKSAQATQFFQAGHPHLARMIMEQPTRTTGEVVFQYLTSHWKPHERQERAMALELERIRREDVVAQSAAQKMLNEWAAGQSRNPPVRVRKVKSVDVDGGVEFTHVVFNALKWDPQFEGNERLQEIIGRNEQIGRWQRYIENITTAELKDVIDSLKRALKAIKPGAAKGFNKDQVRRMREALQDNIQALRGKLMDAELLHYQELEATWEVVPHDPLSKIVTIKDGLVVKYETDVNGKPYWYVTPASNPSTSKGIGSLQFRSQADAFRAMDRFLELGNWKEKPKGTEETGFSEARVKLMQEAMDLVYGIYKNQSVNAKPEKPYKAPLEGRDLVVVPEHWKGLREAMGMESTRKERVPTEPEKQAEYRATEVDPRGAIYWEEAAEKVVGREMPVRVGIRKKGEEGKILNPALWPKEFAERVRQSYDGLRKLYMGEHGNYLQRWVKNLIRDLGGEIHASEIARGLAIRDVKKEVPDAKVREEMTLYRQELARPEGEREGSPYVKGDTFEALRDRIPEKARKMVEPGGVLDQIFAEGLEILNAMEVVGPEYARDMYVQQFWDLKEGVKSAILKNLQYAFPKLALKEHLPMGKKRKFESYREGIQAGYKPRTLDIADIALRHIMHVDAAKATTDLVEGLKAAGAIVTKRKGFDPERNGYIHPRSLGISHPMLHKQFTRKRKNKDTIQDVWWYVHEDIAPYLQKVLRPPPPPLPIIRHIARANSAAKRLMLSLSGFHFGALVESAYAVGGFGGIGKAAQTLVSPRMSEDMLRKFGEYWARRGLMVGGTSDIQKHVVDQWFERLYKGAKSKGGFAGLAADLTKNTVGKLQKILDAGLWNRMHPGLKIYFAEALKEKHVGDAKMFDKYLKMNDGDPNRAMMHLERDITRHINNAFGTQNTYDFFSGWNPLATRQMELATQFMFLAPDWTISNVRVGADALLAGPVGQRAGLRYAVRMGAAVTLYSQLAQGLWMHYYMNNIATDEQREQWEKSGLSMWLWDNEHWPGIRAYINDEGQWVYLEPFKQVRELFHWLGMAGGDPVSQVFNKMSPVVRETYEQATGRSAGSHYPTPYEDMDFGESIPARILTAGEKFLPISFSGFASETQFAFLMPQRRGMTEYSYVRDMTKLMSEFALQERKLFRISEDSSKSYTGMQLERLVNSWANLPFTKDEHGHIMSPEDVVDEIAKFDSFAISNNIDVPRLRSRVHLEVRRDLLNQFMSVFDKMGTPDNYDDYASEIERIAEAYIRLDPISADPKGLDADVHKKFKDAWHKYKLRDQDEVEMRLNLLDAFLNAQERAESRGNLDRSIEQKIKDEEMKADRELKYLEGDR